MADDSASIMPASRLAARTVRGMAWAYGSYVGGRVLGLVATAILAHQLSPHDFGVVALALVLISVLETLSDFGVTQALIIAGEDNLDEAASTAWVFTVVLGLALTLITAALAPVASWFFDEPALLSIVPVLGLVFLVRAIGLTHYALAQRRIDFASRTKAELTEVVVRGALGISLALAGLGAWSLVISYLGGSLALSAAMWRLVPWRPSLRLSRRHLRSQLRFGGALTGDHVLWAVVVNADYTLIGRVLGASALGIYTLAFRLPELLVQNLSVIADRVLFPAYAVLGRDSLGRAFLLSLRYSLFLALPLAVGLIALADPVVSALFGPKWASAVPVMQVLTIHAVAVTLAIPAGTVYKALGRTSIFLWFTVPRAFLVVGSIILVVDQGIVAVAICQASVSCLIDVLSCAVACRLLGIPGRQIAAAVWAPAVAAGGLAVILVAVAQAIESPWPALAAGIVLGAPAYLGLVWMLASADIRAVAGRVMASRHECAAPSPLAASGRTGHAER